MAEKRWCNYCDKIVTPTGKRNNMCPTCLRFVSKEKPKEKNPEPSTEFDMGFSGTIPPEEALRFQRLKQAGIVTNANDVLIQGLRDLEARHLPGTSPTQTHQESGEDVDELKKISDLNYRMLLRKAKRKEIEDMMREEQAQGGEKHMNMEKIMEYMMMDRFMDRSQGNNPEIEILKQQIAQRDRQMEQLQFEQRLQKIVEELKTNRLSDSAAAERIDQLRRDHDIKIEQMRNKAEELKEAKYQVLIEQLTEKVKNRSATDDWTQDFESRFMKKAIENLMLQMEKGFNATEPEKGPAEIIGNVLSKTAETLAPAINAWSQAKSQHYPSAPVYHAARPRPHNAEQSHNPADLNEDMDPSQSDNDQGMLPQVGGQQPTFRPPRVDSLGGNVVTRAKHSQNVTGLPGT